MSRQSPSTGRPRPLPVIGGRGRRSLSARGQAPSASPSGAPLPRPTASDRAGPVEPGRSAGHTVPDGGPSTPRRIAGPVAAGSSLLRRACLPHPGPSRCPRRRTQHDAPKTTPRDAPTPAPARCPTPDRATGRGQGRVARRRAPPSATPRDPGATPQTTPEPVRQAATLPRPPVGPAPATSSAAAPAAPSPAPRHSQLPEAESNWEMKLHASGRVHDCSPGAKASALPSTGPGVCPPSKGAQTTG